MSKIATLIYGVRWGTVSLIIITLFQLIFMAVMARLLDPADFGLVAIANVALRFYSYFSQMGIAPALIQKETLSDGDIRAALALSLGISGFFFLLAFFTAGLVERFFEMDYLALVMQVLAVNFIVFGFSAVSLGLIRRNKAFKALAVIEIISYVLGYGVIGLGAAYFGAGVWSLVAALLTQMVVAAVLSYSVIRFPVRFKHTSEQRSHFISYGGRYSIIGFIEFLSANIDAVIIGKFMGATSAGYYSRALLLANLPVQQPTSILTKVLFPIMSSMSNQHDKQSISVQLSMLIIGCYAFSVGFGVSVAAPDIVLVLLGDKWLESIPVLQVLAYSVGPIYMSNVIGVTLDSMGKLSTKLRIQFTVFTLLAVLLFFAASTGDVVSIAMAVVAAFCVRLSLMVWVVVRLLKIPIADIFKIILCIVVVTATASFMILFASQIVMDEAHRVVRLFAEILFGAIGFGFGMFISRFIVLKHPAVLYLVDRMPRLAKIFRI